MKTKDNPETIQKRLVEYERYLKVERVRLYNYKRQFGKLHFTTR